MKTPQFWLQKNWISSILIPFSFIYKFAFFLNKKFSKKCRTKVPVICIGNIIAGGAGKTPFALYLGKYLKDRNIKFCYLTRGYKSTNNEVKIVEKVGQFSALEIGDEASLLCEVSDTFVSKNRLFGYQEIENKQKYKAIIMDDGLQNFQLEYAIKILLIDGKIGFGNKRIIPSGPMRQSLETIAKDIDLFVIVGDDNSNLFNQITKLKSTAKIVKADILCINLNEFIGKKIIAFCGIAYPQKFFDYCENSGLNLLDKVSFSDHHNYQDYELENLIKDSKNKGCELLTTKKDWVKFPKKFQQKIDYLDIEMKLESENVLEDLLKNIKINE